MDVKDLRTEPALSERNNDGSKYTQGGSAILQCNRNKSYQDIGSNPLAKAEGAPVRPCAVIGPDRVVPPPATSDAYLKKGSVEPWPSSDLEYRRPPDYPHRLHANPTRNISPRQTFQENMQRINVPPTFSAVRHSDSANFNHNMQDRSATVSKNAKPNMASEAKYCDVPYALNALPNEPKNVRDPEMYLSNVNSQLTRSTNTHVWPPGSVSVNPPRTYSVNEPYQYPQYTSCAGQRPPVMPMARPYRTIREDPAYVYPENYYQDAIGRLKHYPPIKERCPQPRYEYVSNYAGQFHPPSPMQPLKYDIPKPGQTHPYAVFPHFKYLDSRVPDPNPEGYQRSMSHQPHYNLPYRTQVIHPTYAQVPGAPQKVQPYPSDGSVKAIPSNKLHYENSNKMYIDYDNARTKPYPIADNYYVNDMSRFHPHKNPMPMPNYSQIGVRAMPSQQYYLKDNTPMKPFDYMPTFRNFEPHLTGNPMLRHAPQFSPNTLAISPTDSSTSNDTSQTHGTSQEDCGYVSQSSTTSVRSLDSGIYRLPHEYYKRHDFRYGPIVGSSHTLGKTDLNSKDGKQKQIDVRQFLQMWNEGEEENSENNKSKEMIVQTGSSDMANFPKHVNPEDQLYVLGLVNVPSEDLSKYEHIEKISKLPENIKGYNNLELFSRFEEAMESCNPSTYKAIPKEYQSSLKDNASKIVGEILPRSVSPLDVEAKISQSVIHKEVGCNFEIKPCSPKMLNVDVAAPAQNILGERLIEKVSNPLSKIVKSPLPIKPDENSNCHAVIRQDNVFKIADNPSCKMIQSPYSSSNMDSVKTNYSLQDLEINSGVCLASLPQLDNEIELNFPEVNQQFINATKKDGFTGSNNGNQRNSSSPDNREDKIDTETSKIVLTERDKTFNKLSKYRKSKTSSTDSEVKNKAVRTDSVIIKNPENIENKILENSLNIPINLSSQSAQWYNNSPQEADETKDNEMALDFSLNKCANDLPIIETDKDVLIKPFQIKHPHISCDNVMPIDTDMSCHENVLIDDITVDSKTSDDSIKVSPSHISCIQSCQDVSRQVFTPTDSYEKKSYVNQDIVISKECSTENIHTLPKVSNEQNNQEIENKPDVKFPVVINPATVDESVVTPGAHRTVSELENKNIDCDIQNHIDGSKETIYKINETRKDIIPEVSQVLVSKDNIVENTVMSNDKDNCKKLNDPHNHTIPCIETVENKAGNMPQFASPNQCRDVNKSKLTTSQIENDFEHDEISANLEKLFRESNEDTLPLKYDNCSSSKLDCNTPNKIGCHQSKELYSPWIQKLLTHCEGSYSYDKIPQKGSVKSIFDPDEYVDKPSKYNIDYLKNQLEQNMEISHTEKSPSKIPPKSNNLSDENSRKDAKFKPESKATYQTLANVTDCLKTDNVLFVENKSENTGGLIKKHNTVDKNKLCTANPSSQIKNHKKRDYQDVIETSKRKPKKLKLHSAKLTKKLSKRDKKYLNNVNVNSVTESCSYLPEKESDIINSGENICNFEIIDQTDVTACSNDFSDFVSDSKKERVALESGKTLNENDATNSTPSLIQSFDASSAILNRNSDLKNEVLVQGDFNDTSIKKAISDDNVASTKNKIDGNSSNVNVTESISGDHENAIEEISMSFDTCSKYSAVPSNSSQLNCGSLSMSDSDISSDVCSSVPMNKHRIGENTSIECDLKNIFEDSGENYDTCLDGCAVVKNNSNFSPESLTKTVTLASSDESCTVTLNKYRILETISKDNQTENIFEDRNKDLKEISINDDTCSNDSTVIKSNICCSPEILSKNIDVSSSDEPCTVALTKHNRCKKISEDSKIENIFENHNGHLKDMSINTDTYSDVSAVVKRNICLSPESVSQKIDVASSDECCSDEVIKYYVDAKSNKDNDTVNTFKDCDKDTIKTINNYYDTRSDDFTVVRNNISPEYPPKSGCEAWSDVSCKIVLAKHQTNQSKHDVMESIFDDCDKNMGELTVNSQSCLNDSTVLYKDNSNSFPMNENQEQKPIGEGMITTKVTNNSADIINDKLTNDDNNDSVQKNLNVCGELCRDEVKDIDVIYSSKCAPDSVSSEHSESLETKDKQFQEESSVNCSNDVVIREKLDESKCKNNVCNYNIVNDENETSCSSNNSMSNNKADIQTKRDKIRKKLGNLSRSSDSDIKSEISLEIVCSDKNNIQEDSKVASDCSSHNYTENKACVENTFTDVKTYNNYEVIHDTCKINALCDEDYIFQRDRHEVIPDILSWKSSVSSDEYKTQETESSQSITKKIGNCLAESESYLSLDKSHLKNIELDNANQESQDNTNTKQDTLKNELHNDLLVNDEFDKNETLQVRSHTQSLEQNEILATDNHTLKTMSSEEIDNRQNSKPEPEHLLQEHKDNDVLPNLSGCVSDECIQDYNVQTLPNKVHITAAGVEYVSCENDKDSLCDSVAENNLVVFENNLSTIYDQETFCESPIKRRQRLKRSFSDSALNNLKNRDTPDRHLIDNTPMWPPKRQKMFEIDQSEQQVIDENLCNFIQNRRNSISSYYNAENVSFCILIDNDCILTEESEEEKICFAEVSEECITGLNTSDVQDNVDEVICGPEENELEYSDSVMLDYSDEKSIQESWLDDVACIETVVSDDVEDADSVPFSTDVEAPNYDESGIFTSDISEIAHGINLVNEPDDDNVSEFENTYQVPSDDDKIILCDEEPHYSNNYDVVYSRECMEKILSESYRTTCSPSPTSDYSESILLTDDTESKLPEDKENIFVESIPLQKIDNDSDQHSRNRDPVENNLNEDIDPTGATCSLQHGDSIHLPESSIDNVFSYKKQDTDVSYTTSSSPEVSSTTFEEKNSSILLKITNYNGSRVSEINEVNRSRPRCKFTESKDYSNSHGSFPKKPLITKAAQKYIPPLKESIRDLKVKLPLPQPRLLKLKQLKQSKSEPKTVKQNILTIPKKQKPKLNFEDVLKNIDEVQIKMHKQNSKKSKNVVPKVVIKKNVNGSHYTSSSSKEKYNPDLTGSKWQPWVFLERNRFIDNMATRNKTKAIFSHRKNTYVLAEQFKKYKSVSNCAKFVISQPKVGDSSKGQLKYTIRLKHS